MLLRNMRIAFPDLWKARAFEEDQKPKFGCTLIFPKNHPQIAEIQNEISRVAQEKWKDKGMVTLQALLGQRRVSFQDGAAKADKDGFGPEVYFIRASNTKRPGAYDKDRTPVSEESGIIYSGCYVNAIIEFWAQDNKWGKRINASLRGVQFLADGEAFGGGAPADQSEFAYEGEGHQEGAASGFPAQPPGPQQPAPAPYPDPNGGGFPQSAPAPAPQQPAPAPQQTPGAFPPPNPGGWPHQ